MLDISNNNISKTFGANGLKSEQFVKNHRVFTLKKNIKIIISLSLIVLLFLPWRQNISAIGNVTTRLPQDRPQSIQSVISGKLEKWYVREGDMVKKGDTIAFISEVKSQYFDPNIILRTQQELDAAQKSITFYDNKIKALSNQFSSTQSMMWLKLKQTKNKVAQSTNKVSIDSANLVAVETDYQISKNQLERTQTLYDNGLKTLTELQKTQMGVQKSTAKLSEQKNKLINTRNQLINTEIDLANIQNEYNQKLYKIESDKQTANTSKMAAIAKVAKIQNKLSNYQERQKFYYIRSPQEGQITQTLKQGLGEILKEGTQIATIMPSNSELAVEIFIKPEDLPLIKNGDRVRMRFDGWPAIVISGWPEAATGIFSGNIVAIDQFINKKGYYRLLISPTTDEKQWPQDLRVGTGVNAFLLLNSVYVWYEIWRKVNGFPPDHYTVVRHEKINKKT